MLALLRKISISPHSAALDRTSCTDASKDPSPRTNHPAATSRRRSSATSLPGGQRRSSAQASVIRAKRSLGGRRFSRDTGAKAGLERRLSQRRRSSGGSVMEGATVGRGVSSKRLSVVARYHAGYASESEEDGYDSPSPIRHASQRSPLASSTQSPPPSLFANYTLASSVFDTTNASNDLEISPFDQRDSSPSSISVHRLPEGRPADYHSRFDSHSASIESRPFPLFIPRAASHSTFQHSSPPESPSFMCAKFIDTLQCQPTPSRDMYQFFDSASESSASTAYEKKDWSEGEAADEGTHDGARRVSAAESLMATILDLYASDSEDAGVVANSESSISPFSATRSSSYISHWQSGYSLSSGSRTTMDSQENGSTFQSYWPPHGLESPPQSPVRNKGFASQPSFNPVPSLPSPPTTPRRTSPASLSPLPAAPELPVAIVVARRMSFTPSSSKNFKSLRLSSMAPRTVDAEGYSPPSPTRPGDTRKRSQVVHLVRVEGAGSPRAMEGREGGRLSGGEGKRGFDNGEIGDWLVAM